MKKASRALISAISVSRLLLSFKVVSLNIHLFIDLLAALAYSPREKGKWLKLTSIQWYLTPTLELIRLGCDLMNLFYVFDEYTDIADGEGASKIRDTVMDAMRNPHKPRPEGELLVGEMAREFVTILDTLLLTSLIPSVSLASGFAHRTMSRLTPIVYFISFTTLTLIRMLLHEKLTIARSVDTEASKTICRSAEIPLVASRASLFASSGLIFPKKRFITPGWLPFGIREPI